MSQPSHLASLLKQSRTACGISQLEMSLRLGVSQRHVSFLESARAQPSRSLLLAWMRETRAGDSLRNAALLHAGYALSDPGALRYRPDVAQAEIALRKVLTLHEPNPGLVFDADWMIVELNASARWLCDTLMPDYWPPDGNEALRMDMIALLEHPAGLLSRAREPAFAAAALLAQLSAEAWARPSLQERVRNLAETLRRRYGVQASAHRGGPALPCLPLHFDCERGPLSFLLVQSVVGLPQNVTIGTLRMELWYPADEATSQMLRRYWHSKSRATKHSDDTAELLPEH